MFLLPKMKISLKCIFRILQLRGSIIRLNLDLKKVKLFLYNNNRNKLVKLDTLFKRSLALCFKLVHSL